LLAPGKLADLTILSGNPMKIDPDRLAHISVTNSFKEGRRVAGGAA